MSLLLEALRKAEETKRQKEAAEAAAAQDGSSSDLDAFPDAGHGLELFAGSSTQKTEEAVPPEFSVSPIPYDVESADTQPFAQSGSVSAQTAASPMAETAKATGRAASAGGAGGAGNEDALASQQEAVRRVFAAKKSLRQERLPRRWIVLSAVLLVVLGLSAGGGWLWWQLKSLESMNNTLPAARPAIKPPPVASMNTESPVQGAQAAVASPSRPDEGPMPAETTAADTRRPLESPPHPAHPEPVRERRSTPVEPAPEGPVRISRGELRVSPVLELAWQQYQADDLEAARRSYQQVLRSDRKNTDALHGLAAIALREGQEDAAEALYLKVLEADPKDSTAQAALVNLRGRADPDAAESRLKGLLAASPASPTLNFALGNLYADQRRWPEAQLAYFNAHTADPNNPDYLYNLAASLDQMHLPKIALDYYRSALNAANGRHVAFDPAQVRTRIGELQR